MPCHLIHAYVDRVNFGKAYWQVHREMDSAYQYFRQKHRILFHDPPTACSLAAHAYPGDPNAISAALLHIETDKMCSADPFLHAQLWQVAKEDQLKKKNSKKKKQTKRTNYSSSSEIEKTEKFFKQVDDLQRLMRLMNK